MSIVSKVVYRDRNALITETLPYETPLWFGNEGFVRWFEVFSKTKLWELYGDKAGKFSIPYEYRIIKSDDELRKLYLVHPYTQNEICDFYNKYKHVILNYCSRSKFSLRFPDKVASAYYEKGKVLEEVFDGAVEMSNEGNISNRGVGSSFFSYRDYSFIYKFYKSYEFHRYERQFNKLMKLDVSKCFHNIYSHSISWAVKDKDYAKSYTKYVPKYDSFESAFDKIMQKANYDETNGIVVGPEVSRVFSEIIFQRVDQDIYKELLDKGFLYGRDYIIKRYIDDFFLFFNSEECGVFAKQTISKSLEFYKLYINENKTSVDTRPFSTPETIAKSELTQLLDKYFSSLINYKEMPASEGGDVLSISGVWRASSISNSFIRDFKAILKKNGCGYKSVVNYSISASLKRLRKIIKAGISGKLEVSDIDLQSFLRVVLEINFFIFSMAPRVRSSYLVGQMILLVFSCVDTKEKYIKDNVRKMIYDEVLFFLRSVRNNSQSYPSIEVLVFLTILKSFGDDYLFSEDYLCEMFGLKLDSKSNWEPDYFQLCVLLNYISNDDRFLNIKSAIEDYLDREFSEQNIDLRKTSQSMLLMDLLCCPFLEEQLKKKLLKTVFSASSGMKIDLINQKVAADIAAVSSKYCFFQWKSRFTYSDLCQALSKKELRAVY